MEYLKISSAEITNAPLLLQFARKKKPIILSTGMSDLKEIQNALEVLAFGYTSNGTPSKKAFSKCYRSTDGKKALIKNVTLLHCVSSYPTKLKDINLNILHELESKFGLRVGFSDHSNGILPSTIAVALGASIIEKHITLSKVLSGPDHKASTEPDEFKKMVDDIRSIKLIMGSKVKKINREEKINQKVARKSIHASRFINKNEVLSHENLSIKRPNDGESPFRFWDLIGKRSKKNYKKDEKILK